MTTYEQALAMLSQDDLDAVDQLTAHLFHQDTAFLQNLIAQRVAADLTQDDLAAAWGRHKTAVSQFEQSGHDPRLSTIRRYAASIGARYRHVVYLDSSLHASGSVEWDVEDEDTDSEMLPPPTQEQVSA